ncbi:leucyl aminopeptidase [Actinomycetospora endophytica]|uniref:Probable cytosol aminopeptidase n=1 Tax=Actinomycetospora endophytica TaxID=2291215 RepID=A0ABS8PGJ7_9PSEU|nr:leucyl aminopeptidase [Actinomycetospora endophytica]MCD2196526.1 leucyl aminopeptidase [Actinomycetospora endophytica]
MSIPPDLELSDAAAAAAEVDVLVIGTRPGASADEGDDDGVPVPPLLVGADDVDAAFGGELASLLSLAGAAGAAEEVVKLPSRGAITAPLLLAVGLGPESSSAGKQGAPDLAEQVRRASGAAARALPKSATRIGSTLSSVDLPAAVEGTVLGTYAFTDYRSAPDGPLRTVTFHGGPAEQERLADAAITARAVCAARDLINTPPNDLYPAEFARRAVEMAEAVGLEVEVLDESELAAAGYGGVLGVGTGSSRPPRLVRLRHVHPDATKHVALVGKGITFDTGGISIKPAANMDHMTSDMSGAACVVATACLAAEQNLPVNVTATVPMAENMPSGTAYRPGDVLTMYGGKTVEVLNTDAEGRLILGDAIVRACEDGPDYLVETSTLTGAQTVALGSRTAGIMGSDAWRDRVAGAAAGTGEGGWAMPLPEELRADLDSRIADIANVTGHRFGGMLVAGIFLREFVAEGVPWAHIDIAGPAFNTGGPHGYTPKGGTGLPVRTLAAVLADVARQG